MEFRAKVDKVLANILILIMALMVINVLWQVFSRYLMASPSSFTDELARYLMIWVGILGAAYVSGQKGHVAIDVLLRKLNPVPQKNLKTVIAMLICLFSFWALVVGGGRLVYITYVLEQYSPAMRLPLAAVYAVIPVSGVLIIYYKIYDMIND